MLRNFLLISLRSFLKNKAYTFINIVGLTLGLASATLIFLFIHDELTYDAIQPYANRMYTFGLVVTDKNGNRDSFGDTPSGWGPALKEKFPDIEVIAGFGLFGFPTSIQDKDADRVVLHQDGELYYCTENITEVMYLPMVKGSKEKALAEPNSMIISALAAKSLFGNADPINKQLTIRHPYATFGRDIEYVVTGVFEDITTNTFFKPKYLLNVKGLKPAYATVNRQFESEYNSLGLNSIFLMQYFRLKEGGSVEPIRQELTRMAEFATKSDSGFYASGRKLTALLERMPDVHFDEVTNWHYVDESGSKKNIFIYGGIAMLILVIASINYMNLATARSIRRAKEVGVRKTLGSKRSELALQFIQESAMTTLMALIVSIVVIILLLPAFNLLTGKTFTIGSLLQPQVLLLVIGLTVFVTVLGGSYPAFYLSGFKPVEVLKGVFSGGRGDGLRKWLVTFQFAVAIFLAVSTNAVISQMNLMQQSKLNEAGDQILSIRYGTVAPNAKYPGFKNALEADRELEGITIGNHLPRHDYFGGTNYTFRFRDIDDKEYRWSTLMVDFDFPKTYNLEFVAGRDFDRKNPSDSNTVVINERAAKELHKSNEEVLGITAENTENHRSGRVIGVVKDFPYQSAYHAINPLVISPRPEDQDRIVYIKLPKGKIQEKIKFIERTWKETIPGVGFDYWFVSDEFNRLYKKERKVSSLAKIFAALAMGITILGLYGLASYMAEQKTKEVGIRKAMGSSVGQIITYFLMIYLKIFVIATLIAVPLAYYFVNDWLKTFAYRIDLGPMVFITSVALVLGFMLVTISYEVMKAARANPVKALKHE